MQLHLASLAFLASAVSVAKCWTPASSSGSDQTAAESLEILTEASADGSLKKHLATKGVEMMTERCSVQNAAVRREYSTLSNVEKLGYTRAVQCLMAKPAITPTDKAPGARSRYDDIVATHINQTWTIHRSGSFLAWHRQYVWTFEQALRNECGYKGYVPYWSWAKSSQDPLNSPYLDGSEYSQGGNGEFEPHNCTTGLPSRLLCIEPGEGDADLSMVGGGCVKKGPYAGVMANLTATVPSWPSITAKEPLSYGPRCIRHDISVPLARKWSGDEHIVDLLRNPLYQTDIGAFQDRLQYTGNDTVGWYGLHQFGHFLLNGDPAGDFFNSPNEPLFWLHHAMVDRVWWIWQNQKPVERAFQVAGTRTMNNKPPSEDATVDDTFDMGYNGGEVVIKDLVSTIAGPYCYIYL
ncbi:Di-copper centre-containing protein [Apiospora rasikravindrae]|uniref:Di-copper centre-containing protein n=1 Tax=Apiospora rasikravindrae TaxID=990691 RepID=A0ABR1TBI8_9PEZI